MLANYRFDIHLKSCSSGEGRHSHQLFYTHVEQNDEIKLIFRAFSTQVLANVKWLKPHDVSTCLSIRGRLRHLREENRVLLGLVVNLTIGTCQSIWQWENEPNLAPSQAIDAASHVTQEVFGLLKAQTLGATVPCDLVMAPWPASNFVHEAVGHLAEADNFVKLKLAKNLSGMVCPCPITISDDPKLKGTRTYFDRDDQGNVADKINIIHNGYWRGILSNEHWRKLLPPQLDIAMRARRTAKGRQPLARQSNTFLVPMNTTSDQMIKSVENGFLVIGCNGGGMARGNFFLRPVLAQRIHNGKLINEFIKDFVVGGNILKTVGSIEAVGPDLNIFSPYYGCDKEGENQLPVCFGAPHILIKNSKLWPTACLR